MVLIMVSEVASHARVIANMDLGTGSWFPILWSRTKKVRSLHDVGLYGSRLYH